jgi:endonuclease III
MNPMAKSKPLAKETPQTLKKRAAAVSAALRKTYAGRGTALHFKNPFELLIATILSAQCTDDKVNEVTAVLFPRYPDARALAGAKSEDVEPIIHATGFYRQKAKSILSCARTLTERHGGQVPESMDELTGLPGVGRKTANLVRACAMGRPGLIVDTHFKRVIGRLGLTDATDPDKIECAIADLLPESEWTDFSNALIWHGRRLCVARQPRCPECPALKWCVFGQSTAE